MKTIKKIKLTNSVKVAIIVIIALILLFSVIFTVNAYLKPATLQKEVSKLEYHQVGNYNYVAYLNKSLLYEGKETLMPGQGTIFRNITKNINASLLYRLTINKYSKITGTYTITAQITTDNWNKTYTIVSETLFKSNGTYAIFSEQFPIDYLYYENITHQIEEETELDEKEPMLIIQANILLYIESDDEIIYETLNPSLTATLDRKTIDIEFGEDNEDSGEGTPLIKEVTDQDVIEERNIWTIILVLSIICLILIVILLKRGEKLTETEKENKKIMKKYKEWIVIIDREPIKDDSDVINVNSMEDLIKISEELGKPIFYYSKHKDYHNYYVLDESIIYRYYISGDGIKTKIVKCPKCQTKIEYSGISGEKVHVKCPKCNKEGDIKI